MFKLVLEKAEEPEIKFQTSVASYKKQENFRKTSTSAVLTMPKPLTVWIKINCGKFWKRWEYQTTWPASWETYMQVKKQQLKLVPNWERSTSRLYIVTLFNLYAEYIIWNTRLDERQAGINIAGRNINNIRYADDTSLMAESEELESLDESERAEWKSWLKTQHSKNKDHSIPSHHFLANRWGNDGNSNRLYIQGLQNHCRWWLQPQN